MPESTGTASTAEKPHRTPAELAALAFDRIRIVPAAARIQVRSGDRVIASSVAALELHETDHDLRYYLPRADVDLTALRPIAESSHCPFKGDASEYWTLADDEATAPVAWSYPDPIPASLAIAGYIAFYDSVSIERAA